MEGAPVSVATVGSRVEGELIVGLLRSSGLRAAVVTDDAGGQEPQWQLGLSAVLEEKDGTKSYWALSHPNADKPDFHHPDCFVAQLP